MRLAVPGIPFPPDPGGAWSHWGGRWDCHPRLFVMRQLREQFEAALEWYDGVSAGDWPRPARQGADAIRLDILSWMDAAGWVVRVEFAGYRPGDDDALRAALLAHPVYVGPLPNLCRQPFRVAMILQRPVGRPGFPGPGLKGWPGHLMPWMAAYGSA
ncbi:hypothetical protein [Burkholderia sp. WAC0059]|uniref:hypothetical protein n=1 Tax=Burkholderia sp. WAC0059 TaxID=2066022 RepID=UPI0011AF797E|nr:hypothetical protein [Burkholderia sp. WAC0059]